MERALFYQLESPTPGRFAALRRSVRLAESLGLERVWLLPGSGPSGAWAEGAPGIWLAAIAAETERIRLGWGMPGLWPARVAPVREAEQAAALDVASEGRLDLALLPEVAVRAGARPNDAGADDDSDERALDFHAAAEDDAMRHAFDEGIRMLVDMWAPATFSWRSARFTVPPIDVVPKPLQRPHPPLWLVGWTAEHARAAGRAGLGLLDVSGGGLALWSVHRACQVEARAGVAPDALVGPARFAVAVDLAEGSELAQEAERGFAGPARRVWLAELEAAGIDAVVLRASLGPGAPTGDAAGDALGDGTGDAAHDAADPARGGAVNDALSRRIRWLAASEAGGVTSGRQVDGRRVEQTVGGEGQ